MTRQILTLVAGIAIACVTASSVSAVGTGLPFLVCETQIAGANPNVVLANSMDFTYHSCVNFTQQFQFRESGYFWVSSFQDADSEVDSQINYIDPNGYRIYGIYRYQAQQVGRRPTDAERHPPELRGRDGADGAVDSAVPRRAAGYRFQSAELPGWDGRDGHRRRYPARFRHRARRRREE